MPQATWRGFLRLSLVTCPVYVSPATARTKPIRLHQVWQPASVDVDEDELLPPRPPPGPTRVYSCNSMCTQRGRDAGREDPRSDDQYSRVTAADRQQRAERARGDPYSADRTVARGQGRPARGQDAQPGTAFRRYAEKLLRQPCALSRPDGYRARGAIPVRHPDHEPDCGAWRGWPGR